MLGKLSGIFRSEYTVDKLNERYTVDYVNNTSLWDSLPPHVRSNLLEEMSSHQELFEFEKERDPYHIFKLIQLIHAVKWLNETGYGEKLRSKLDRLTYKDDYGDYVFDESRKELARFVDKRLYSIINAVDGSLDNYYVECARKLDQLNSIAITWDEDIVSQTDEASSLILEALDVFANNDSIDSHAGFETDNPYEYEKLVAEKLCSLGWSAHATSGSGDQGADVIAEQGGIKLVIQCKLYSQPIGNKAVQEVASAERFFGGSCSAVVTNNEFTKSARQLADSLDVFLVHHSQLEELSNIVLGEGEPRSIYSENTIDIARVLADNLESLGWETSYDPEESTNEERSFNQILCVEKEGASILIGCTAFEGIPVDKEYIEIKNEVFESGDDFELLVVTSSSGFTDEAIAFASDNSVLLLDNSDISDLDKLLDDD